MHAKNKDLEQRLHALRCGRQMINLANAARHHGGGAATPDASFGAHGMGTGEILGMHLQKKTGKGDSRSVVFLYELDISSLQDFLFCRICSFFRFVSRPSGFLFLSSSQVSTFTFSFSHQQLATSSTKQQTQQQPQKYHKMAKSEKAPGSRISLFNLAVSSFAPP